MNKLILMLQAELPTYNPKTSKWDGVEIVEYAWNWDGLVLSNETHNCKVGTMLSFDEIKRFIEVSMGGKILEVIKEDNFK